MCLAAMCLDFGGYCNLFWLGRLMRLDCGLGVLEENELINWSLSKTSRTSIF